MRRAFLAVCRDAGALRAQGRRLMSQEASGSAAVAVSDAAHEAVSEQPESPAAALRRRRRKRAVLVPDDPELARLQERQIQRERDAINDAVLAYRKIVAKATGLGNAGHLKSARHLLNHWFPPLVAAITETKDSFDAMVTDADLRNYGHYINVLTAEKLAVISLHSVLSLLARGDMRSSSLAVEGKSPNSRVVQYIAEAVQAQVNLAKLDACARMEGKKREKMPKNVTSVQAVYLLSARAKLQDANWDPGLKTKIGSHMLRLVLETATVKVPGQAPGTFEVKPAFEQTTIFDPKTKRTHGAIKWHPRVQQNLQRAHELLGSHQPRHLPMLVPPRPWTKFDKGGYLLLDSLIMRGGYGPSGPAKAQLEALRLEQSQADQGLPGCGFPVVLEALNVLGRTPWRINQDVLAVMEEVWESGGGIAQIPSQTNNPLPKPPASCFALHSAANNLQLLCYGGKPMPHQTRAFNNEVKKVGQHNREKHSMRCNFLLKLQVAQINRHEPAIYFPHNIDFRGRAYTMHPHLNHLGADDCRGLLLFAQAQPLGERGLTWLRIQVANLFGGGIDKKPLAEREQFTIDNMALVSDSATNPVKGARWWKDAEDPWQCLAACIELHRASQCDDPTTFQSSLPVHQDGSCNGLQHYAALARDEDGGRAVNLLPGDAPADVYRGIANLVKLSVEDDLSSGSDDAREAARLIDHVDRKLVKQTVMTSVYGVTFIGARDQLFNRLKEKKVISDLAGKEGLREGQATANYAARKVLEALGNMFGNARSVMDWLNECAKEIAHHEDSVKWRTPVGLPVVQPYRKRGLRSVYTVLQTFSVPTSCDFHPVMKSKQRTAFPPNYIHSLDSAHMMLTACATDKEGITFAGVHDSFWTHAGTVDVMNRVLRETFVDLHGKPLLQQLYENFQVQYPNVEFSKPPASGTLRLDDVRDSTYFFS